MSDLYVITGATGNIGHEVVAGLLKKGKTVRAVARTADKLKSLAGAEAFPADLSDAAAMKKAFAGAKAVFVMVPPHYGAPDFRAYQNGISRSLTEAVAASGVKYVVNLSSIGGHLKDKTGPIAGLHEFEERLNGLKDVNVVHLRPAYFMENHFMGLGLIKQMGANGGAMRPDVAIAQIATKDIAAVAVELLAGLGFSGKSARELLGPRDLSLAEATRILGAAIGKNDLKYNQFPYEAAEKAMTGMGLSPDVARLFIEMTRGFNDGLIKATQPRSAQTNTPTTFEEFSKVLAAAYRG